ncbi:MAG TPA: FAD-dependent thymidylate synthase [Candidatus Paceibacterota bacterium]|nr:FAD-dependent thymidylate synthase [Candidatus Paceibacterota bacterium]HRY77098.1 FAD-dependent thymidylate synthase [Candidatus Paceibacterota bacterium]
MIKVSLISKPSIAAEELVTFGAHSCYQGEAPKLGAKMDIKNRLFNVGHQTTFQHGHYTFFIEGIAVGDVTLGLHLASVFYNSGQRSGRFCAAMFKNPNFDEMAQYLNAYYSLNPCLFEQVMDYLHFGYDTYNRHLAEAEAKAKNFLELERPYASKEYIQENAPKMAQEQMRVFIPVIFPTALTYTVNLSALAALYHVAWSPPLKDLTQKMADSVLKDNPQLQFIFYRSDKANKDLPIVREVLVPVCGIAIKPRADIISSGNPNWFRIPDRFDLGPIDLLPFDPGFMDNNVEELKTEIEISLATMGQDQRHRTVRRSQPIFTGDFYLAPIPKALSLAEQALVLMRRWRKDIFENSDIPLSLACSLAPYGAMVRYRKSASYNALAHEFSKRLCWSAQEEIYHASMQVAQRIARKFGPDCPFLAVMKPPCAMSGSCAEGKRYCGRDIREAGKNPLEERRV